jgi:SAM-dependent methyltransferase
MTTAPLFSRLSSLSDPTRCRLLLLLEQQELAVNELCQAVQLPQSTVSRHLRVLGDDGWIASRANGNSNWYRLNSSVLEPDARRLWNVVREQFGTAPAARRDAERIRTVLAGRHSRSQEFFATSAGDWDRLRTELFGVGIEWMALGGLLDAEWVVGDLGAGTGQLAESIAPFVASVIAVDESPAMLASARQRLAHLANVELRLGSLEAPPIEPASLDIALIVLVLHHVAEPSRAIREASRTLKPKGRLIVVDMMPHEHGDYRDTMGHQWLGFDGDAIGRWFGDAGLDTISYHGLPPQPAARGPLLFVASARKLH